MLLISLPTIWLFFFYFLNFSWNIVSYFQVIVFKFLYHHHTIKIIKSTCNIISSNVWWSLPAGIYLFKVSNRNTRTRCEICSKLTIKTPKRRQGFLWFLVADSQDSKFLSGSVAERSLILIISLSLISRYWKSFSSHCWNRSVQALTYGTVLTMLAGKNCVLLNWRRNLRSDLIFNNWKSFKNSFEKCITAQLER